VEDQDLWQVVTSILPVKPQRSAMPRATIERLVECARAAARARGIRGSAYTPFMLAQMAEQSGGATVRVNCDLAIANASLAATLAAALADRAESRDVSKELDRVPSLDAR
jgi:pseudouridine-5'-phosphate glycosidase